LTTEDYAEWSFSYILFLSLQWTLF
jgi:hypothetical protein